MRRSLTVAVAVAVVCAACSEEPRHLPGAVPEVTQALPSPSEAENSRFDESEAVPEVTQPTLEAPSMPEKAMPLTTATGTAPSTTTASGAASSTAGAAEVPSATAPVAPSTTAEPLRPEWPVFKEGTAPGWPFHGVVQLWPDYDLVSDADGETVGLELLWSLRYWSWKASPDRVYPRVDLPGLRIECLGQVALVHDEHGVEVGGPPGVANAAFRVRWGGTARELDGPSDALLAEAAMRPSNVAAASVGDWVRLGSGEGSRSYAMRDPARPDGERWRVQARHDGELVMMTAHPGHLECYSGVTWLSLAATGEFVMCGANSAAMAFVTPAGSESGELVLPDPEQMGDYLSCAAQLDLYVIPLAADRRLS